MARAVQRGECRVWTGQIHRRTGYGLVWANGRTRQAHVVSFELHHGLVPDGLCVLHSCDNRPCIEPTHLHAGTRKKNSQEMYERGRAKNLRGADHGMSKLTEEQIREARRRYRPYDRANSTCALAREFGVTQSAMHAAIFGRTWRHV